VRAFPFETPIAGGGLIDRSTELHRLHLAAVDGAHVRLAAPRRYGKTSLLLAHADHLEQASWRTVHVDLYGVASLAEVCARIASAYGRLGDPAVRARLESLGARLGFTVSTSGIGLTFGPKQPQPSHDQALTVASDLLDLPLRLHEKDRRRTLVVFDEFQDLLSAGPALDGLLRAHVQYHGDAATYVYAGSQPSLMRMLFTDHERPLYGQAEPLELGPLPLDEVQLDLAERFASLDEHPGEALPALVTAGGGHPQRTMLLAHLLHRELTLRDAGQSSLPEGPELDGLALADALVALALRQTNEAHQAVWDRLSASKKSVLAALADGVRPTGARATEQYGLSRASLQSAVRDLGREGQHLRRDQAARWQFVDPLFALWVSRRGRPTTDDDTSAT
jgi:hypothetical protein